MDRDTGCSSLSRLLLPLHLTTQASSLTSCEYLQKKFWMILCLVPKKWIKSSSEETEQKGKSPLVASQCWYLQKAFLAPWGWCCFFCLLSQVSASCASDSSGPNHQSRPGCGWCGDGELWGQCHGLLGKHFFYLCWIHCNSPDITINVKMQTVDLSGQSSCSGRPKSHLHSSLFT